MKILILGGTKFLGRHIVEAALARGHEVTIFHRGLTNPKMFIQVEELLGDRTGDLNLLRGRKWDAAIDTSGYFPQVVRSSVDVLKDAVQHYTFVSTISVYDDQHLKSQADETAQLLPPADDTIKTMAPAQYGPLKVACEDVVHAAMAKRALIARPGLLVGPHDPTDRFTWWIRRIARGGKTLAPGNPSRQIQFIDARDVADWIITMTEVAQTGTYNVTGPEHRLAMKEFLDRTNSALAQGAEFSWIDDDTLLAQGVSPWMELPLWIPDSDNASLEFNLCKVFKAGLSVRSLAETVLDTFNWDKERRQEDLKAGISAVREAEVLARTNPQQ
ncbi:MAG: NAD-dependent epimerase/dehydratase [uncultured bacterium]|nr:MAG: NAD-dependent epimerase/dehydratase [uncultured bacterium]